MLAQSSTSEQIQNYQFSQSDIISKGRRLLVDLVAAEEFANALEVRNYLIDSVQDENYLALYPVEDWLLLYLNPTQEALEEVLLQIQRYDPEAIQQAFLPDKDLLLDNLSTSISRKMEAIEIEIKAFSFLPEYKDILLLNLDYLSSPLQSDLDAQKNLNERSDEFMLKYPGSNFSVFIRQNIRYVDAPSPWGFAAEFFTGFGILTDGLGNDFRNGGPIGIAFDINYKRIGLYLRDYIGFSRTKSDMSYNTVVWEKNSQVRIFLPEFSVGLAAIDNRLFKIAPFIGMASMKIGPTQYDLENESQLRQLELEFTTTYTAGINLDIKLGRPKFSIISTGPEDSYWFLHFRYGYNSPHFEKKYPGMTGDFHNITIGLGGFGRKLRKDL